LESAAIKYLCAASGTTTIFFGQGQESWASQAIDGISFQPIPNYWDADLDSIPHTNFRAATSDVAYLRHTSGTSSGLPKPIVQKHWGAVGALPSLTGDESTATFTTTPLYHGGLADCFRAWTSGAAIWFFPEGNVPVTEANVIAAVRYAQEKSPADVRVAYFTSVPYVLQSLTGHPEGLQLLQTMELVGVGGAALAPSIGDELVEQNVKLVSRMGSAECGFLMSSHRDYDTDKEWQYLRPIIDENLISFEARGDGLFELVAKNRWPLRAKQNREDGSYATSDLFQPHPHIPNAWRYHSRSDAQIALANGKKFDPAPLENAIVAGSRQLEDVLIFGTGRAFAGALLFPARPDVQDKDILEDVWPVIERLNEGSQSHARLAKNVLLVVQEKSGEVALEKSSKGTIMRRQAEERYADQIEMVYNPSSGQTLNSQALSEDELCVMIKDMFSQVLGRDISPCEDLFRQGVDSISCIQIRKLIESSLLTPSFNSLPLNIIYEQGTIQNLSTYIKKVRQDGIKTHPLQNGDQEVSELKLMVKWAEAYGDFASHAVSRVEPEDEQCTVVLTGATGALGAHILHAMRKHTKVCRIYCLVRATTPLAAHQRVSDSLQSRGLDRLVESSTYPNLDEEVVCVPSNLSDAGLGLSDEIRRRIGLESSVFIHAAWTVNFSLRLRSFEDHCRALHHALRFATSFGSHFIFISSIASVSAATEDPIRETLYSNPSVASPLGYSRSKWVAEQICVAADQHCGRAILENERHELPRISVVRVGQLCGNETGVWNASEAYPLMLSTAKVTGCLPSLQSEALNWLPVNKAAQAILEIVLKDARKVSSMSRHVEDSLELNQVLPVFHVLNPHRQPKWNDMLQWLLNAESQPNFEVVPPDVWLRRLEEALKGKSVDHPSQKLLDFWHQRYQGGPRSEHVDRQPAIFDTSVASIISPTMAGVQPLKETQVLKMWRWIRSNVDAAAQGQADE
jgi:thioester reductase-like protein